MADLIWHDYPDFRPEYSPIQMLEKGVFGGTAFNKASLEMDLSPEFRRQLDEIDADKVSELIATASSNFFGVLVENRNNRQLPDYLQKNQVQKHRGWFHWYVAFYDGRELDQTLNTARIQQWKDEIVLLYRAMNSAVGDAKTPWKQGLLQYAWNFSKTPNFI